MDRYLKRNRNVPGLDRAIRDAFLLGKAAGLHGAEDRVAFGQTARDEKAKKARKRAEKYREKTLEPRMAEIRTLWIADQKAYPHHRSENHSYDDAAKRIAPELSFSMHWTTVVKHLRTIRKEQ